MNMKAERYFEIYERPAMEVVELEKPFSTGMDPEADISGLPKYDGDGDDDIEWT
ncbi:MAG: hypothetical protein LBS01_08230 [Prevotellaceae bacterium]|jgi:hypothetical protein|nr:hypothetical protein [Prevotellaceae bacterium]